ncbi:MAG: putative DNA binding domain-containing protein [Betaproteobacteria bacterium]|nr:putative DNA binding domain-containing protein [Betaproteobacteria bacterium]
MTEVELLKLLAHGEDSRHQFKLDATNADSLAAELAAYANSGGDQLFLGVGDDGSVVGLDIASVQRLNQLLSNAASQHVCPPVNPETENVQTDNGIVMVVSVADGSDKPYMDNQGRIWVKCGADKRRVRAREEMQRMFQRGGLVHADVVPVSGTTSADIDEKAFRDYFIRRFDSGSEFDDQPLEQLLQNLGLGNGYELNLAGLMLFGRNPQRWQPAFQVKAVTFPGTEAHDNRYLDSEDINGTLSEQYKGSIAFLRRNLHHVQRGRGFNTEGLLEIPEAALEELLVNALIHRDYFTSASIRIMVFADRVEIASPGHLPDSLSVEAISKGRTNHRNPRLTEHASKLLPYKGLGTGIRRALKEWPRIELIDDVEGNQFSAVAWRPEAEWTASQITDQVTDQVTREITKITKEAHRLLEAMQGEMTRTEIQAKLGLKHLPHFRDAYLRPALEIGFVEMTVPDKPNSRLQKYRLTVAGRAWLQAYTKMEAK